MVDVAEKTCVHADDVVGGRSVIRDLLLRR